MKRNKLARNIRELKRKVHKLQSPALRRHIIAATYFSPNLTIVAGYLGVSRASIHKIIEGKYVRLDDLSSALVLSAMKKMAYGEKDEDKRRVLDIIIRGFDRRHIMAHQRRVDLPTAMARFVNDNELLSKAAVMRHFTDQSVGLAQCHTAWRRLQERLQTLPELMCKFHNANPDATETDAIVRFSTLPETKVIEAFHDYQSR